MKILSIDTTAEVCSAALCEDEKLIAQMTVNTGNTHSETLLPVVEQILKITETDIDEIDLFACTTGPGSFTGVRIGVATVKGIAYGKNKPCVSVSTLEALAFNLRGYEGLLCPVMNARRGQVYNALFACHNGEIERLTPDRALSIAELDASLGERTEPIYLCGDGYNITEKGFVQTKATPVPEEQRLQSGYSVCRIALEKYKTGEAVTDVALSPIYLRPSQAERERNERLGLQNQ